MGTSAEVLLVAALVASSALYVAWRLTPARLRLRLLDALGAQRSGARWAARLRARALAELGGACGACRTAGPRPPAPRGGTRRGE